jgi:benzoyl-CoA reductase/2-hydroxyglutaryl-CoA dehydratase subunit BcrC/BadD/HgdB
MIDILTTREELDELAATATHIANLGPHFISPAGASYWSGKASVLHGLSDVLEEIGSRELTLENLQAAAEKAIKP